NATSTIDGCAVEQILSDVVREGFIANRVLTDARASDTKHRTLELLQAQVIFKFPRILEQINLRLAVRPQTNRHTVLLILVRGDNSVAEIPFSCWAGANYRTGSSERGNRFWRNVNSMHSGETLAQQSFSFK